uniref:Rho-GAP domain-containing protein n=1 Tax=Malurus cyaneus samueli TaxID=2593467 RepID=A0A8C5TX73_9PASS
MLLGQPALSSAERCVFQGTFGSGAVPGPSPRMQPMALQSLSELERASLQELALFRLQERLLVGHAFPFSHVSPDCCPHTFGIPLSQVIANDRACRQLQEAVGKSRRLCLEVEATVTRFRAQRHRRLGAMSVDSITDLSDNASKLLEALQLSHPHELEPRRSRGKKQPLSLNPISWQVPRIVDRCCTHLEMHGLQTVGIFRVGSSKKRVQQLREEFDRGLDVFLDEHQSVHDVAALLKEFLRDMPDSLIPRELYGAFLSTATMEGQAQLDTLQLLLFLLPPCHSDTLLRLLRFLGRVARHAERSWDAEGHEIPGNKMTASNLATVFGPNILQKEKPREKDALNLEDSAAIILVLQRLIEHHHSLFMVSPEMQCDVLRRLFQTDPDVIEYLLRRKSPALP